MLPECVSQPREQNKWAPHRYPTKGSQPSALELPVLYREEQAGAGALHLLLLFIWCFGVLKVPTHNSSSCTKNIKA